VLACRVTIAKDWICLRDWICKSIIITFTNDKSTMNPQDYTVVQLKKYWKRGICRSWITRPTWYVYKNMIPKYGKSPRRRYYLQHQTSFMTQSRDRILHTGKIQSRIVSSNSSDAKETFSDARSNWCDVRPSEAQRRPAEALAWGYTLSLSEGTQGHAERIRQFE